MPSNPCEQASSRHVELQTSFTAPVTALEKGEEYYVLFPPQPNNAANKKNAPYSLLDYRNGLNVSNVPRWITIDDLKKQDELLLSVVFASGSPFPIFPAHRINLPKIGQEWLVDGGYAHNIPIQAANQLGAHRLLIISSSPRERLI